MTTITSACPTARQMEYQDWELGIFLHFGIRTFYEGHKDWDGQVMPAVGFNPSDLPLPANQGESRDGADHRIARRMVPEIRESLSGRALTRARFC